MQLPTVADASGDDGWSASQESQESFTWDPVTSHGFLQGSGQSPPRPPSYSQMQQTARYGLHTGPVTRDVGEQSNWKPAADDTSITWRCVACGAWDCTMTNQGIYECTCCGGTEFKPVSNASDGQWVWIPSQEEQKTPGFDFDDPKPKPTPNGPRSTRSSGRNASRKPNDDPGHENQEGREGAESEATTNDPVVDPETLQPVGHLSRRQRRAARRDAVPKQRAQNVSNASTAMNPARDGPRGDSGRAHDGPPGRDLQSMRNRNRSDSNEWRDDVLRQLTKRKDDDWNPKKGPSPGVKYRSGQPPAPPQWSYAKDDPRAFSKWMRKLEIWKLQVANYLPNEEAAMLLYTSLRGEAEEELEWVDLKKVNHPNGIDFIVETLKKLQTREIYLKRRYLFEFEAIQRQPNESIRAFANRYHRCERTLAAVGIDVTTMYDSESRGARLLDRLRLNPDQQRLILVGSGQSIEFEAIRDAAILQFPDHRPTPYVTHAKEFEWNSRRNDRGRHDGTTSSSSSSTSSSQKGSKGKGKGNGGKDGSRKGNPYTRSAYVAEHGEEDDDKADAPGDLETIEEHQDEEEEEYASVEEAADDPSGEPDEADETDLELAAHCLTVTARRLNGLRLGRKFNGGKSLAQRKQESHCAVCGEKGHWKGDPECSMADKSQSDGAASNASGGKSKKGKGAKGAGRGDKKQVMTVTHPNGTRRSYPLDDGDDAGTGETFGNHFVFMVKNVAFEVPAHCVHLSNLEELSQYLVMDTACQRTCCSTRWLSLWENRMKSWRLKPKKTPNSEPFEFGHGETQYSSIHAYLPTCFTTDVDKTCLVGTCVIDSTNDIPLLGSNALLCKLQAIIDLPKKEVHLQALRCSVALMTVNGHLSLQMTCFPSDVHKCEVWKHLSKLSDGAHADPELVLQHEPNDLRQEGSKAHSQELQKIVNVVTDAKSTSPMASTMASPECREVPRDVHGSSSEVGNKKQGVVESPRSPLHGGEGHVAGQVPRALHPRPHSEVGQSSREIQQVFGMRKEMEVERRATSMARPSATKRALAAAFTVFVHSCVLPRPEVHPGEVHGIDTTKGITVEHHEPTYEGIDNVFRAFTSISDADQGQEGISKIQEAGSSTQKEPQRGGGGRDVQRELRVGLREPMKKGNKTWLRGYLRSVAKVYHTESGVYEAPATHADHVRQGCKVDAPQLGLSASQPIDKEFDFDLY